VWRSAEIHRLRPLELLRPSIVQKSPHEGAKLPRFPAGTNEDNVDKPEDVIGYWRAVELFTPNDIPKVDRLNPVRQTSLLDEGLLRFSQVVDTAIPGDDSPITRISSRTSRR